LARFKIACPFPIQHRTQQTGQPSIGNAIAFAGTPKPESSLARVEVYIEGSRMVRQPKLISFDIRLRAILAAKALLAQEGSDRMAVAVAW
jgi:hypothetical protein